jgi:DEAD/DEAH box helicase domain-containing protein
VRIKALIPDSVNFDYVDENKLEVNVENTATVRPNKQKEDVYKIHGDENAEVSKVLYFEFIDGELRPKVNRKKGYTLPISLE